MRRWDRADNGRGTEILEGKREVEDGKVLRRLLAKGNGVDLDLRRRMRSHWALAVSNTQSSASKISRKIQYRIQKTRLYK